MPCIVLSEISVGARRSSSMDIPRCTDPASDDMKSKTLTRTMAVVFLVGCTTVSAQQPYPGAYPAYYPVMQAQGTSPVPSGTYTPTHVGSGAVAGAPIGSSIVSGDVTAPVPNYTGQPMGLPVTDFGGCTSSADCNSCSPCNSCGGASCGCGCGNGLFGSGSLFGSGGLLGCGLLGGNGNVCRPSRIWGGAEYLLWWTKERTLPVLVTTSPDGTPVQDAGTPVAGALGQPTTAILFGGEEVGDEEENGFRATAGIWLDSNQTFGLGGRYFELDTQQFQFQGASNGNPILARPFFNLDPLVNAQDALLVAYPGISTGGINATSSTDLVGYDVFARYLIYAGYCNRIDFIAGYHRTELDNTILVQHDITSVDGVTHGPVGTNIQSFDEWSTYNEFNGGEIGILSEAGDGRLTWSLLTKISFGNMKQHVNVNGGTVVTDVANNVAANPYGLLNLPSNIGSYERDEFAIVPELNVGVAYSLSSQLQLTVGYSLIYWSDIVLANEAVDTVVNPTQVNGGLVGPNGPIFTFPESESFWVQGLNFGLNFRF